MWESECTSNIFNSKRHSNCDWNEVWSICYEEIEEIEREFVVIVSLYLLFTHCFWGNWSYMYMIDIY